jgi:uncharacterized membrane protein
LKTLLAAIAVSAVIALGLQIILPFPFGFIFGITLPVIIIWSAIKKADVNPFTLINYRRADPKTEKEKEQNKEAYRILKKRFLDGEITKEEYDKLRKDFDIDEPGTPSD